MKPLTGITVDIQSGNIDFLL